MENPWQPIETAPKDGRLIDLKWPDGETQTCCRWGTGKVFKDRWFYVSWDSAEAEYVYGIRPNTEPSAWRALTPIPDVVNL